MTARPDRSALLWLSAQQLTQPELLEGLAAWLRLGLLTDIQVRQFCQEYLVCPLPAPLQETDFVPLAAPAASAPPSRRVARSLRSFMAEISVIWLLFLGVFLVVVSSGVLAASQWQNFSPVGQYGILFAYTLGFWGASEWAARRQTLQWTSRMLQIATLLILPVNFWMIDGLRLWQSRSGGVVAAIATLSLTAVTIVLLRPGSGLSPPRRPYLAIANSLALDGLHWGWGTAGIPLTATYLGTIGTALLLFWQFRRRAQPQQVGAAQPSPPELPLAALPRPVTLVTLFAALLLVGRAVLVAQVPLSQVGLALGVCGWLLGWLTRRDRRPLLWERAGAGLLLLGWAVSVTAEPPVQAIAVSGLGLWLLADRLVAEGGTSTLTALLLVGGQTYCLLWPVLPPELRQQVIAVAFDRAGVQGMPGVLLGLAGWPYLWLVLALAAWLRRQSRLELVRQTEQIALGFGLMLSLVSLVNPLVRSLSLTLAAFTLAIVLWRRVPPAFLVYLAQLVILSAIGAWVDWAAPNLDQFAWACGLLGAMAAEWGASLSPMNRLWRQSAWHLGLALAGLSYVLLLAATFTTPLAAASGYEGMVWLLTPVLLTGLSCWRSGDRSLAAGLSAVALLVQLPLLRLLDAWLISLAVATGLMLINTLSLRRWPIAGLTIAFALGLEAAVINRGFASQISGDTALILVALNLWLLWICQSWLGQSRRPLYRLYAAAASRWATGLSLLMLLILTLYSLAAFGLNSRSTGAWVLAAALTAGAIAYLLRQQPTDFGFYSLGWGAEALAAHVVSGLGGGVEELAIATLGLGGLSQLVGDWLSRLRQAYRPSWHGIPILCAGLGMLLGHLSFTGWTGLYTLAAALIGIGVGRRQPGFKPLTGMAVLLASGAAYELLGYQLSQVEGGHPGDAVALMAGLAGAIAWTDVCLIHRLSLYLRLSRHELLLIAHLHWGIGSTLALLSLPLSLSSTGAVLWIGIMAGLCAYALAMGNLITGRFLDRIPPRPDANSRLPSSSDSSIPALHQHWTYAGLLEAIAAIGQALYRAIPDTTLLLSGAAAIAAILAMLLYFGPWQIWGWSQRPWQTVAMILPGVVVMVTATTAALQSLLMTAAFYAWLAKAEQRIRLSYLSIGFLDWAVLRFLQAQGELSLLGLSVVAGGSLLYLAQVDPALQPASAREQRHWLRSLATALICLTAFYQAEIETGAAAFWVGALAIGFSIGLVFLGLILRVRAFLYLGTATFILRVLRLLWLFINNYSLLLWAMGIVLGLSLIWIAATFEARRSHMNTLLQSWLSELESWE